MGLMRAMGRGALAGAAGTAAMTVTQTLEMRASRREPSTVPGQVGAKLLRLRPADEEAMDRLSQAVHWGHGILNGALRGLIASAGLSGRVASAAHFGGMWSSDALLYRALGIAPAPWKWRPAELATDVFHKGVYALVTGAAYDRLDR